MQGLMVMRLLWPLAATIVIELGVLLYLGERRGKVLWGSVAVNILTNVPLNFWAVYVGSGLETVVVGELLVVLVEALWFWWLVGDKCQGVVYSLLCNAISFLMGEVFIIVISVLT